MFDRPDLIYLHDGSFAGFLCCVFESFVRREAPLDIVCREDCQTGLYAVREIESDRERAGRVFRSIGERMGEEARQLVQRAFLFGEEGRDLWLYRFLCRGYRYGPAVCDMLGDEAVSRVQKMALSVSNEAHLLLGFVRFAEYDGALLSQISPKHFVLPVLREHFCDRYPEETFMIHDKTHQMALIYRPHRAKIVSVKALELPPDTPQEQLYRQLWRGYHQSATIAARVNPRCQRGNMPKRFWGEMCEMADRSAPSLEGARAAGLQGPERGGAFSPQRSSPHRLAGE